MAESGGADRSSADYAHTDQARQRRAEKARELARYAWDRRIAASELLALPEDTLRRFARAAGVHPPSSRHTWDEAARLLDRKEEWARRHPERSEAARAHPEERIMWIRPSVPGW